MSIRLLCFLAAMSISSVVQATNYSLVMASCDDLDRASMDPTAVAFSQTLSKNWKTSLLLDQPAAVSGAQKTTRKAVVTSLTDIVGQVGLGDQVLFSMFTHGSQATSKSPHGLCLVKKNENGIEVAQEFTLSDADIKQLLYAMKEKGAKVGLLDDSCFSGDTVDKFGDDFCAVSATRAEVLSTSSALSPGSIASWVVGQFSGPYSMTDLFLDSNLLNKSARIEGAAAVIGRSYADAQSSAYEKGKGRPSALTTKQKKVYRDQCKSAQMFWPKLWKRKH